MRLYSRKGERLYVNGSERQRFRKAAESQPKAIRLFCLLLLHSGCRLSEARNLRARDIQADEGVVSIRTLKQRQVKVREVPLPPEFIWELVTFANELQSPRSRLWSYSRTTAWRRVKEVMVNAGVTGAQASPKGLRHGFGVAAIMAGIPVFTLKKWMGHEKLETTMIYATVSGVEERALAERMWRLI